MASSDVVMEVAESDELAGDEGAQPEPMVVDAGGEAAVEDASEGASEVGEAKSASAAGLRSVATTLSPCARAQRAICRPKPVDAPVTSSQWSSVQWAPRRKVGRTEPDARS